MTIKLLDSAFPARAAPCQKFHAKTLKKWYKFSIFRCFQTVLTPFDLFCAETLLKIELEWVQNVAILCQNGQFGTALLWTLQVEDKETHPFLIFWQRKERSFADRKSCPSAERCENGCQLYLLYLPAAVFVERKYAEDINRPRLQYFSSKQTFHCIFKGRSRKKVIMQNWP